MFMGRMEYVWHTNFMQHTNQEIMLLLLFLFFQNPTRVLSDFNQISPLSFEK